MDVHVVNTMGAERTISIRTGTFRPYKIDGSERNAGQVLSAIETVVQSSRRIQIGRWVVVRQPDATWRAPNSTTFDPAVLVQEIMARVTTAHARTKPKLFVCERCERTYKTAGWYENHIKSCA